MKNPHQKGHSSPYLLFRIEKNGNQYSSANVSIRVQPKSPSVLETLAIYVRRKRGLEYEKRVIDDQLKEKLECKGAVLIEGPKWCGKTTAAEQLFEGKSDIYGESNLSLEDIAYLICRGGWPISTYLSGRGALSQASDYYDAVVNIDICRVDNVRRDPEKAKRIMQSYARNQGSQIGDETIVEDIRANEGEDINVKTIPSYIDALKKIFVIEDMKAWNPNLRSKTPIRSVDTRYFIDPSIAAAALGFRPGDLMNDMNTFGFMFETLAIRDLRVFAEALNGTSIIIAIRTISNVTLSSI